MRNLIRFRLQKPCLVICKRDNERAVKRKVLLTKSAK